MSDLIPDLKTGVTFVFVFFWKSFGSYQANNLCDYLVYNALVGSGQVGGPWNLKIFLIPYQSTH